MSKLKLKIDQKPIILALSVLAVALVALVLIDLFKGPKTQDASPIIAEEVVVHEPIKTADLVIQTADDKDRFREEVPHDIVVPNVDTVLTEAEKLVIALPEIVSPASPGASDNQRIFNIQAENDVYTPREIIAYAGDVVSVRFTAVDKDYDLIFPSNNMILRAKKGETKSLTFSAFAAGNFSFYCSICGGPELGPTGNFIIVQP